MFTDTEVALSMSHRSSMRAFSRDAQGLVDEMDDDIRSLRRQLASAKAALATERALRLKAELTLERVLALPV